MNAKAHIHTECEMILQTPLKNKPDPTWVVLRRVLKHSSGIIWFQPSPLLCVCACAHVCASVHFYSKGHGEWKLVDCGSDDGS